MGRVSYRCTLLFQTIVGILDSILRISLIQVENGIRRDFFLQANQGTTGGILIGFSIAIE